MISMNKKKKKKKKKHVKQLCSAYAGVSTVPVLELVAKELNWRLVDVLHPSASERLTLLIGSPSVAPFIDYAPF
jgi:hypothetical protein